MSEHDAQLVVRLPQELVDRVDAYAQRMRQELPDAKFKRAEAVRVLLTRALDQAEEGLPKRWAKSQDRPGPEKQQALDHD